MSRGLRNNNPGNIRKNKDVTFQFEVQHSTDADFKQFHNIASGYRAMFTILAHYLVEGHNTIAKIITRWAPDNENDTAAYIKKVAKLSGVKADKVLKHSDGENIKLIVAAMSWVENGIQAVARDVDDGYKMQTRIWS